MNYESSGASDDFDPPSVIAASDGLAFRFEVLIASLTSKISGAIYVLIVLAYGVLGTAFLYFAPSRLEIAAASYSLVPSLLIILLFAVASTAHYVLTLRATRRQAQVALERLVLAHKRVEEDLAKGI